MFAIVFPAAALMGSAVPEAPAPVEAPSAFEAEMGLAAASLEVDEDTQKEIDEGWQGALTAGVTTTSGNTDSVGTALTFEAIKRREDDRFTLVAAQNYQKDDTSGRDEISQRRNYGKGKYDYFFSEKTYGLAQVSAENDLAADVTLRGNAGLGVGRQFYEQEDFKLAGEIGMSWFYEDYESLDVPDPVTGRTTTSPDNYFAARFSTNVEWVANDNVTLGHLLEVFQSVEESDDTYIRSAAQAQISLTEKMFLQLQWILDWDNTPNPGNTKTDSRTQLTLGWSF